MNANKFKSFKYNTKLVGQNVAHSAPSNNVEILKNAAISVPLKYRSNFWRSFEMVLMIYKLQWTKFWVLDAAGANNADSSSNNILFTIKDTKLYVLGVTLSAKDDPKTFKAS